MCTRINLFGQQLHSISVHYTQGETITYRALRTIYGRIDGVYFRKQNTRKYPELPGVVVEGFNNEEQKHLGKNQISFYCRNAI